MNSFSHIIFDLDGTLTDNTEGIGNSLNYALQQMHIDGYNKDILDSFIGPPLQWGFSTLFGMNEKNTELAVSYFREYYSEKGYLENVPYPGIPEMLERLHLAGKLMYIATAKYEKFAQKIIEHFGFDRYIIQLTGADYGGRKASKTGIISSVLDIHGIEPSHEVIMVGDTVYDIEGGKENGLSTLAVKYGFGNIDDLQKAEPDFFADDVEELYELLM